MAREGQGYPCYQREMMMMMMMMMMCVCGCVCVCVCVCTYCFVLNIREVLPLILNFSNSIMSNMVTLQKAMKRADNAVNSTNNDRKVKYSYQIKPPAIMRKMILLQQTSISVESLLLCVFDCPM